MSLLKSVIITLPKEMTRAFPSSDLTRVAFPKSSLTTSFLTDSGKARMDARKMAYRQQQQQQQQQSEREDMIAYDDSVAVFESADQTCIERKKKRRLDHLTWEEKLQRKKLKNRVAAQTSRDRKKAKLDELEEAVRALREKNELLVQECAMLRTQNDTLLGETKKLMRERDARSTGDQQYCSLCQIRVDCAVPSLGSAAGWDSAAGIVPDANTRCNRTAEDPDPLLALEELFGELQGDEYIHRLDELAESLLREVNAEVEGNPRISNEQMSVEEDPPEKSNHPETMVGQASEDVEAGRVDGGVSISYVREGGPSSSWRTAITCDTASEATTRAGVATSSSPTIKTEIKTEIEQESELTHDSESTLYGTYDEATKSVTIIYPGEENGDVGIQECVQEITTDDANVSSLKHLRPPSRCSQFSSAYTMSPGSHHSDLDADYCDSGVQQDCASLSDGGYESHDSPHTRPPILNDIWHESFTELFPALA